MQWALFHFKQITEEMKPRPRNVRRRGVAQFGRALRSGRRGRRFKSCHLDQ